MGINSSSNDENDTNNDKITSDFSNEEKDDIFSIMKNIGIIAIGPADLDEYRKNAEDEYGDDAAFEFNLNTMITSFGTVEHWKQYTKDIIEWDGEKFFFLVVLTRKDIYSFDKFLIFIVV